MDDSRRALLAPALVLVLGLLGCDGSPGYRSPTAPGTPPTSGTPPPPPPPPSADLTGSWEGTLTVLWDEMDGGGSCEAPASASLAQTGATVTGTLVSAPGCMQDREVGLDGLLEGDRLRGRLILPGYLWFAAGKLSGDRLSISAFNVTWELRRRRP
jgi:hypothetical protein